MQWYWGESEGLRWFFKKWEKGHIFEHELKLRGAEDKKGGLVVFQNRVLFSGSNWGGFYFWGGLFLIWVGFLRSRWEILIMAFPFFKIKPRPSSRSRFFFLDIDAIFSIVVSLFKFFATPSFYARTRFFDLGLHFNFSPTLFWFRRST